MKTQLIEQYKEMKLTYLDYDGYNEVEYHDNDKTYDLYEKMFNEFIEPIFKKLDDMKFNHEHVIFNYFYSDDKGNVWAAWYEPQIHLQINAEDYNKEIEQGIKYITK